MTPDQHRTMRVMLELEPPGEWWPDEEPLQEIVSVCHALRSASGSVDAMAMLRALGMLNPEWPWPAYVRWLREAYDEIEAKAQRDAVVQVWLDGERALSDAMWGHLSELERLRERYRAWGELGDEVMRTWARAES